MIEGRFRFEPFSRRYDRTTFSCGEPALDRYLQSQAGQDQRRGIARVFLLIDNSEERIAGYYTLSATSILSDNLPQDVRNQLPRYEHTPALLVGRLAVDETFKGLGLGRALLMNALWRAWSVTSEVGAFAVIVDTKNRGAVRFYQQFGFEQFPESPDRMFLPMRTLGQLFEPKPPQSG
jgi:GNAT superfamily N-acetyltransferase